MPFKRPTQPNEPSDRVPAQSFQIVDGTKKIEFDLSALADAETWEMNAPGASDSGKFLNADGTWQNIPGGGDMLASNNLSEVDPASARTNLELGTAALLDATSVGQNLITAVDKPAARAELQLGSAALVNTGTASGNVPVLSGTSELPALSGVNLSSLNASNLASGTVSRDRLGLSTTNKLTYVGASTLTQAAGIEIGNSGNALWLNNDDGNTFLRMGTNTTNMFVARMGSDNAWRTASGSGLFINDNTDADTYIATGSGGLVLGNTTSGNGTEIYGTGMTIAVTSSLTLNLATNATGDIYYRNSGGNFTRLAIGSSGDVLTVASGIPSWAAPSTLSKETITKVKTARETVTSSSTLQDDDHFTFTVKANKTYVITALIALQAANTVGLKWAFTVPTGASGRINQDAGATGYPSIDMDITTGFSTTDQINSPNANHTLKIYGYVVISSTAGTVTFQWAQGSSNVAGTYLERGSVMTLTEV